MQSYLFICLFILREREINVKAVPYCNILNHFKCCQKVKKALGYFNYLCCLLTNLDSLKASNFLINMSEMLIRDA